MTDLKEIALSPGDIVSESSRAKELAALPDVTLLQGTQDNQQDLHKVFQGVYGAWVNTDGFTLGEKDELFYGFRAYEIARSEGLQHYVWANIKYAIDAANFDKKYYCGYMDSNGRVLAMKSVHATNTYDESSSEKSSISNDTRFSNFNGESCFDGQGKLQPLPSQICFLWQVFLERVHPLTKVIHAPTVQPYLVDAVFSTGRLPKDMQALIFSILSLATLLLGEDESRNMLGSSREHAFQRFSAELRTALQRARCLELPSLTLLQALLLYLISLQGRYGSRKPWILSRVCVRMAQKLGLHRDGELLGLSPFETEMRRRVWWQTVRLDLKSTRAWGLSPSTLPLTTDCKIPTDIDDEDLLPDATEPFETKMALLR
ncbi:fungal-specific transcription factor domain-containing protein [Ilyonectria destructans]|nr:fungal-specific transcription factor domain-containing protein [Ilyonectria destructans]